MARLLELAGEATHRSQPHLRIAPYPRGPEVMLEGVPNSRGLGVGRVTEK